MKSILISVLSIFLFFSCKNSQNNESMEYKLPKIGMEFSEFAKELPEVVNNETDANKQYGFDTQVQGLDGGWSYNFKDGKLEWFMFSSYEEHFNQENFDKYLVAAQNSIEIFKQKYGEPTEFEFENKTYKDPYVERHWGYDVISAVWKTDEMDFKVEFTFMGSRGEYNFLFKMEFHESGYEYF